MSSKSGHPPVGGQAFFTSVGCMDGRVQKPVAEVGRSKFGAEYPDTITEAGLVGLLALRNPEQSLLSSLEKKINISIQRHNSRGIVVHGHEDCAASDAVSEKQHERDILKSAELIKLMFPGISVVPVFVKRKGEAWTVEEL